MNDFWLGALAGSATITCLVILTLIALRSAERSTPMTSSHWPIDDEDDIDRELRTLTRDAH